VNNFQVIAYIVADFVIDNSFWVLAVVVLAFWVLLLYAMSHPHAVIFGFEYVLYKWVFQMPATSQLLPPDLR
jgi:hypothetical protein